MREGLQSHPVTQPPSNNKNTKRQTQCTKGERVEAPSGIYKRERGGGGKGSLE